MYIYATRLMMACIFLVSGLLASAESKLFEKDSCTVTIPEGWEWDSEKVEGSAYRCRAYNRLSGRAVTFQILEGAGTIDAAFGNSMDSQFSSFFDKKISSKFIEADNGRCYQHTFLKKQGDACVIRYHIANDKLYALSLVGSVNDIQNRKIVEEIMSFLKIKSRKAATSQTHKPRASNYGIFMPFSSESIMVLFWWVCLMVSMLKWFKRIVTFKPQRLHAGVLLFGALRNQLIFFSLLVIFGIIASFSRYAETQNLRVDSFVHDSAVFFGFGLLILSALWGITVKRVGRPDFNTRNLVVSLIIPVDVILMFVLLHQVIFS